ncbi:L-seryl-tRNA(Sec) selenium transferase [bacterium]|nr:L-seryl-tRNA(Sec) selenium transferase [bacterium]
MSKQVKQSESGASSELLRRLPQVDSVLASPRLAPALSSYRRDVVLRQVRAELQQMRESLRRGADLLGPDGPSEDFLLEETALAVLERLARLEGSCLRPVVNGSGVLIHTNLGRALPCAAAQEALSSAARAYCNLEMDLHSGERTRRDVTLEPLLQALSGAEAATVVNNNAAAVLLVLHALAGHNAPDPARREVIASRGELVEIGGSYRVPDMLRSSGCVLVEVGTTNRTRISDYEKAITPATAMLLKTHPSNYRIHGFTEEASLEQLAALGRRSGIPVYFDMGSGYLAPEGRHAVRLPEPDILGALEAGADIVSFSGDKLLGGPQAGIVLASSALIRRLRSDPLWRCLRIDKFTASALAAVLLEQMRRPEQRSPGGLAEQLSADNAALRSRADELAAQLAAACPGWSFAVLEAAGSYGGGSLPEEELPSFAVTVQAPGLEAGELEQRLRRGQPAVAGGFIRGSYCINVLALLPGDGERIAAACQAIAQQS